MIVTINPFPCSCCVAHDFAVLWWVHISPKVNSHSKVIQNVGLCSASNSVQWNLEQMYLLKHFDYRQTNTNIIQVFTMKQNIIIIKL